jgi:hypothetical protein
MRGESSREPGAVSRTNLARFGHFALKLRDLINPAAPRVARRAKHGRTRICNRIAMSGS